MNTFTKFLTVGIVAPLLAGGGLVQAQDNDVDEENAVEENGPGELEQLQALIEEFRSLQEQRVEERRALAQDEEFEGNRSEAMRALIEEQAAEQRVLGQQIRDLMKAEAAREHADRRGPPDHARGGGDARPASEDSGDAGETEMADHVRALNEEFRTARDTLLDDWREHVKDTPREERREMYRQWREDRAEQLEELRENRRAIREAAQDRAAERRNR